MMQLKKFLYDVYGYDKIRKFNEKAEDFLGGREPKKVTLKELLHGSDVGSFRLFLSGTIMSTYKPTFWIHGFENVVYYPFISKIRPKEELSKHQEELWDGTTLINEDFQDHIYNRTFFDYKNYEEVKGFFDIMLFKNAKHSFKKKGSTINQGWLYRILDEDFDLKVVGSSKNNYKRLVFDFNAEDFKDELNRIVAKYYWIVKNVRK